MSDSKSEFILTKDGGISVFVEHGDFGLETNNFIHGIAHDMWHGDINPEDKDYHKKRNPTLQYWKKHNHPRKPGIHLKKRSFRFTPPKSECFLGPEAQYEKIGDGEYSHEVLKRHPGCRCSRCFVCDFYDDRASDKFWRGVTGPIKVEV